MDFKENLQAAEAEIGKIKQRLQKLKNEPNSQENVLVMQGLKKAQLSLDAASPILSKLSATERQREQPRLKALQQEVYVLQNQVADQQSGLV